MIASVVILAAGRGDRMQRDGNKMLLPLGGEPLLCRTVRAFTQIMEIDDVILVVRPDELETIQRLVVPIAPDVRFVEGGETRRDSALAGVRNARRNVVLIHDGARPFPTRELIHRVMAEAVRAKAVIPILPITDLLHSLDSMGAITSLPSIHASLAHAQTPQGFHRDIILRCLENAPVDIRDDASAILLAGGTVSTIPGECTNVKVTRPNDLPLAQAIAAYLVP